MEIPKVPTNQEGTQRNSNHRKGADHVSPKSLSTRPHRSAMPAPDRKQNFEEAPPQMLKQYDGDLRRLAK